MQPGAQTGEIDAATGQVDDGVDDARQLLGSKRLSEGFHHVGGQRIERWEGDAATDEQDHGQMRGAGFRVQPAGQVVARQIRQPLVHEDHIHAAVACLDETLRRARGGQHLVSARLCAEHAGGDASEHRALVDEEDSFTHGSWPMTGNGSMAMHGQSSLRKA